MANAARSPTTFVGVSHKMKNAPLIIAFSFLTGCSVLTGIDGEYPSDWPSIVHGESVCTRLNGEYLSKGKFTYSPKGGSEYLAYRFGFDLASPESLDSSRTVKIACDDGKALTVNLDHTAKRPSIKTLTLSSDGLHFENGNLIFPINKNLVADSFGGYSEHDSFQISVASDGSLIGKQITNSVGLALWFIPFGGSQTFWFRWQKLP